MQVLALGLQVLAHALAAGMHDDGAHRPHCAGG
jgi:hypothetical protein